MNQEFTLQYNIASSEMQLNAADQQLVTAAKEALTRAYAPYSKFQVGAAVRLQNGQLIEGNNQENIAYPSGLCAESAPPVAECRQVAYARVECTGQPG